MVQNKDDYDWFKTVVPDGSADEILEKWANLIAGYVVSRHDFPKSRKDLYVAVLTKDIETFGMACMSAFFCCSFLKTMKLHE